MNSEGVPPIHRTYLLWSSYLGGNNRDILKDRLCNLTRASRANLHHIHLKFGRMFYSCGMLELVVTQKREVAAKIHVAERTEPIHLTKEPQ